MITRRSEVYVSYLYTQLKYKGITAYIKNKKGRYYLHHSIK